jgi:hypothetical protein
MILNYRKKPIIIQAIQANGTPKSNREIINWTRGSKTPASMDKNAHDKPQLSISTLKGARARWVSPGDYIVKQTNEIFFLCQSDIFHERYERVFDGSSGD